MRTAAALPDRVGAGASFHGGFLVTDKPNSPHLLAPKIKARLYFAIAADDDKREPDVKNKLRGASPQPRFARKLKSIPMRCTVGVCPTARRPRTSGTPSTLGASWSRCTGRRFKGLRTQRLAPVRLFPTTIKVILALKRRRGERQWGSVVRIHNPPFGWPIRWPECRCRSNTSKRRPLAGIIYLSAPDAVRVSSNSVSC